MFIRGPCLQSSARSSVPRCLGLASKSQPRGPALGCFKGHAVRTYPDLHTENAILLSKSSEVLNETSSSHAEPSKDRVQRKHGPRDGQSLKQQIASFMGFVGMARSPQQPSQEQAHEGLPAGLSGSDADEFNLMSAEEAGDSPQHQDRALENDANNSEQASSRDDSTLTHPELSAGALPEAIARNLLDQAEPCCNEDDTSITQKGEIELQVLVEALENNNIPGCVHGILEMGNATKEYRSARFWEGKDFLTSNVAAGRRFFDRMDRLTQTSFFNCLPAAM
eukprot:scaffold33367_cov18-Tisochrysis_lutea.AAC.1